MTDFSRSTPKNILRAVLLAIFPWIPPVLFEKTDFYFHLTHNPDWYYNLSGYRLFVDLASFAVCGIVLTMVMTWYPLGAWFSGVTYLPLLLVFQTVLLIGVPQIATGILAARMGRSLKIGAASGPVSLLFISAFFWTPECPGCDRSLLYLLIPAWTLLALVGGITELGLPPQLALPKISGWLGGIRIEDFRRVGLALVLTFCLWTLVARDFWD